MTILITPLEERTIRAYAILCSRMYLAAIQLDRVNSICHYIEKYKREAPEAIRDIVAAECPDGDAFTDFEAYFRGALTEKLYREFD